MPSACNAARRLTPDGEAVTCAIDPPRTAEVLTVQLGGYAFAPDKARNIGMDNIEPVLFTDPNETMVDVPREGLIVVDCQSEPHQAREARHG